MTACVLLLFQPGNILIKQGRYKLGDFGLATPANQDRHLIVEGDSRYMAKELLSDNEIDLTKVRARCRIARSWIRR